MHRAGSDLLLQGPSSRASSPGGSGAASERPLTPQMTSLSVESPSPSDNDLTEVPFSPMTSEGRNKSGKGEEIHLHCKSRLRVHAIIKQPCQCLSVYSTTSCTESMFV